MTDAVSQLLLDAALAAAPVLAGGLMMLVRQLVNYLKERRAAGQYWFYLNLLEQTVSVTVKSLMPRVERWKCQNQNGRLTAEQIRELQREARQLVLSQLSQAARQALRQLCRDLESMIAARLEAAVYDTKNSRKGEPGQETRGWPENQGEDRPKIG
ncbi:hypothetical protein [Desulforamulus hydrothermalis]|uniref:Uncharacterized protein n=1 Tax=Desulforamulus hydrothermalis Lam5 = DSM 18033 TaxID=1121428 RepID=K8E7W1_9FIRM|nr:hypothetical protein [Desulforamulus hydrothermalis]CCO07598.1 conserved hypothetical protein [Desulforamulus hydrothermalis Lam5 = DSM 18033]SHH20220.1 hypothetical protein SAMN02745177_01805 [Desulforamulus hydrothermalis Lam5 = DSM 18033]